MKKSCIFCKQPLEFWENFAPNNGPNYYEGEPLHIYQCKPCQSQQNFQSESGRLTYYNFLVRPYMLCFYPGSKILHFEIQYDPPDDPGNWDSILELNFMPNLTPQNTNVKRIKLFLLFS